MSTQYNQIQVPYGLIRRNTISLLERENIRTTILPYIKDARILDLACGSGHYTYPFLAWGAASVVGVDISSSMLDAARRSCPADVTLLESPPSPPTTPGTEKDHERKKTVAFVEADVGQHPGGVLFGTGGGFDVVFGAWLLNYAPHRAALTDFYKTIARNLRDGGVFLSITVPPTPSPRDSIATIRALRPWERGAQGGLLYECLGDVDDGVASRMHGRTVLGDFEFDFWWLVQGCYESCAREGGLGGELTWGKTDAGGWLERGEWEGGASREEMETYEVFPGYGVLMIKKS